MPTLKESAFRLPGVRSSYLFLKRSVQGIQSFNTSPFLQAFPPGHFYSPVPDIGQIRDREYRDAAKDTLDGKGIDLREEAQLNLLEELARYYDELPFSEQPDSSRRFYYDNDFYSYADAVVLFGMLRHFRPKRVVEVGSGFSSALMLDTDEAFLGGSTQFTFIEPYPERLSKLLANHNQQHCTVLTTPVQSVDLDLFRGLKSGDMLFIDSSHVVKCGSDVAFIVFEILPQLKEGVVIHFHDICWPFEYPTDWIAAGWAWNEAYFLRAFLQFNTSFEILYFNSFMNAFHRERLEAKMPLCLKTSRFPLTEEASSLWLRRIG